MELRVDGLITQGALHRKKVDNPCLNIGSSSGEENNPQRKIIIVSKSVRLDALLLKVQEIYTRRRLQSFSSYCHCCDIRTPPDKISLYRKPRGKGQVMTDHQHSN